MKKPGFREYRFYPWQQPKQSIEVWEPFSRLNIRDVGRNVRLPVAGAGRRNDISGDKLPRSDWSKSTQTATYAAKSRPLDF